MPLGRFKKDDGGNVEEYPYGQGGQQMPIILQPGQLRGEIASQGRHQGKGPHEQQGTAQTELGIDQKDAQDDGNGQFVDDNAVQYGRVSVNWHPFHQGVNGQAYEKEQGKTLFPEVQVQMAVFGP